MDLHDLRHRVQGRMPAAAKRRSWYDIRNATDDGTTVVRIFDQVGFPGVDVQDFIRELDGISTPKIRVEINSPGGDVFDGIALYNALRTHPAHVTTRVTGLAASIASVIVQAGDRRVMLSGSQAMVHRAWAMVLGDASELHAFAELLEVQDDVLAGIYASRSGRPASVFRKLMDAETWLPDERAVSEGLADEVEDPARKQQDADAAANEYARFIATSNRIALSRTA